MKIYAMNSIQPKNIVKSNLKNVTEQKQNRPQEFSNNTKQENKMLNNQIAFKSDEGTLAGMAIGALLGAGTVLAIVATGGLAAAVAAAGGATGVAAAGAGAGATAGGIIGGIASGK